MDKYNRYNLLILPDECTFYVLRVFVYRIFTSLGVPQICNDSRVYSQDIVVTLADRFQGASYVIDRRRDVGDGRFLRRLDAFHLLFHCIISVLDAALGYHARRAAIFSFVC